MSHPFSLHSQLFIFLRATLFFAMALSLGGFNSAFATSSVTISGTSGQGTGSSGTSGSASLGRIGTGTAGSGSGNTSPGLVAPTGTGGSGTSTNSNNPPVTITVPQPAPSVAAPLGPQWIGIPCDNSLLNMPFTAGDPIIPLVSTCMAPFGTCGGTCAGSCTTLQDPGMVSLATDSLIRAVVGKRINNLYNGYNGVPPYTGLDSNQKLIYPTTPASQYWNPSAVPVGTCDQAGACNIFCNDVKVPLPVLTKLPASAGLIAEAQGFNTETGQPIMVNGVGGQSAIISDANPNLVDRGPSVDDFSTVGAIDPSSPYYTKPGYNSVGKIVTTPYFAGWPIHNWSGDASSAVNGCYSGMSLDPNGLIRIDPAKHDNSQDWHQYIFDIKSIAWDDSSVLASTNQGQCDLFYVPDYSTATTMSALHTGALVQALWMSLSEVINEIKTGKVYTSHPVCQVFAANLMSQVRTIISTLLSIPGACARSLLTAQTSCNNQSPYAQADCYNAAMIQMLSIQGVELVAECEVYARAEDTIQGLFLSTNSLAYGAAMMLELKNYATSACLMGTLHNLNNGGGDEEEHSNKDGGGSEISYLTQGSGANSKMGGYMTRCFPYAYTAAFTAYLQQNPFKPLVPVAIQGIGNGGQAGLGSGYVSKSVVTNAAGVSVPAVQLQNCQILDNYISPSPSPSPGAGLSDGEIEQEKRYHDKNAAPNPEPQLTLALMGLSLLPQRRRRRNRLNRQTSKNSPNLQNSRSLLHFISCGVLSSTALTVYLTFGLGCDVAQSPELDMNIMAFVNNYCVSRSGILLTATTNGSTCCRYDKLAGTSWVPDGNGTLTLHALNFGNEGYVTEMATDLHGTTLPIPPGNTPPPAYCPGLVSDVNNDLVASVSTYSNNFAPLLSMLTHLNNVGSANAGAVYNSATLAVSTTNPPPPSQFTQSGFNYKATPQNTGTGAAASAGAVTPNSAGSNALSQMALNNTGGLLSRVSQALGFSGNSTPPPVAISADSPTGTFTTASGTSQSVGIANNNPESTGSSGRRGGTGLGNSGSQNGTEVTLDGNPFGLNRDASNTTTVSNSANSDDPADYFTRIAASENLFKVVERKYREKTPSLFKLAQDLFTRDLPSVATRTKFRKRRLVRSFVFSSG